MTGLHALFQRRIDGDDALLRLARLRFEQAGLAAEVYAGSAAELASQLRFAPVLPRRPMVHLARSLDLLDPAAVAQVARLAREFGSQVSGFVVHDRRAMPDRLPELVAAGHALSQVLTATGPARLFIEYAAGVRPDQFVCMGQALRDTGRAGLCVDIGHVGIRHARREFARRHPGRDLAGLSLRDPGLEDLLDDVQACVASSLPVVLGLIRDLQAQQRPVHFHLHDGHPLVQGLSDHFGFLLRLPLPPKPLPPKPLPALPEPALPGAAPPGERRQPARVSLDPLYGVAGAQQLVQAIAAGLGPLASMTLEIHEHDGRLPLPPDEVASLFGHWRDLANAERMNLWLRDLTDNATLVRAGDVAS